jgi:hypothetical protein
MGSDRGRYGFVEDCASDVLTPFSTSQSNGANLSFPEAFGIADNKWLIGLINGAPYLASAAL